MYADFYITDDNLPPCSHASCTSKMKKLALQDSITFPGKQSNFPSECWFDDACILDMDYFVKTLATIKNKGVRPDLIGSIITHYAAKWLPELTSTDHPATDFQKTFLQEKAFQANSPDSATVSWMKKRFFVETLTGVLPPEMGALPCNFLLRLLRTANMVGAEPGYRAELERRVAWQLDQATLKEIMIPNFSHTSGTLLDVELVLRLVKRFVGLDEAVKSGTALVKVAKLVDSYLAEAALDSDLRIDEFVGLASALPSHARALDDGLYRAIDTYLKAHPGITKQEKKALCRLIDSRKLSTEASIHAAQNERLPIRAVIQVLFSEQTKLNHQLDWSGSFSGTRSPNLGLDPPVRCLSKREMSAQQTEIKKLREDVLRLQRQCNFMQVQMERILEKKKGGLFKWTRMGFMNSFKSNVSVGVEKIVEEGHIGAEGEVMFGRQTPMGMKPKAVRGRTPPKWRKSMS